MGNSFFQVLAEFFKFELLIAEDVLRVLYVLCAICIPVFAWYFLFFVVRRYAVIMQGYQASRYSALFAVFMWFVRKIKFFRKSLQEKVTWQVFTPAQKLKFIALYVLMVGFAELFLRLVFEYLIAFIHMHDWLKPVATATT